MRFEPLPIDGAVLIHLDVIADDRGSFTRTFCAESFAAHGLPTRFVQSSQSFSQRRHTLRGLHYQAAPESEDKLIRCPRGAIFDVIVDVREQSPTFGNWHAVDLNEQSATELFVPQGIAHGLLTLVDETEVLYDMTTPFNAASARGIRFDDATLGIAWPATPEVINKRDQHWPDWESWKSAATSERKIAESLRSSPSTMGGVE